MTACLTFRYEISTLISVISCLSTTNSVFNVAVLEEFGILSPIVKKMCSHNICLDSERERWPVQWASLHLTALLLFAVLKGMIMWCTAACQHIGDSRWTASWAQKAMVVHVLNSSSTCLLSSLKTSFIINHIFLTGWWNEWCAVSVPGLLK